MSDILKGSSVLSLDQINLEAFIQSLNEIHNEIREGIDGDPEYGGELDEPLATIENLLELLDDVDDLSLIDVHHGVSILAHLLLLQEYLAEFSELPEGEDEEIEITSKAPKKAKSPKKKPAKKK